MNIFKFINYIIQQKNKNKYNDKNVFIGFIIFMLFYFIWKNKIFAPIGTPNIDWIDYTVHNNKYGKQNPKNELNDLIKEFGPPSIMDKRSGGVAIWNTNDLRKRGHCWERIEIHDEIIIHDEPLLHADFLYVWYKLNIPKNKICDIISISDSITYDPLKQLVRVRCNFMGTIANTIYLLKYIIKYNISGENAKQLYNRYIIKTLPNHPSYEHTLYKKIVNGLCNQ